jgi:putative nucleotidyltransferase with HDIG domain
MNRLFTISINNHQDLVRYIMVVLFSIFISLFIPKTNSFKFDFEIGKPWRYDNLIAAFDFGIYKSKDEIAEEKKRILAEYTPYYTTDEALKSKKVAQFILDFNNNFSKKQEALPKSESDSAKLIQSGLSVLEKLYFRGIINADEATVNNIDINLFETENATRKARMNDFYTLKEAHLFAEDALQNFTDETKTFLLPLIENAIEYNILYDNATNKKFKEELINQVSLTRGKVQEEEMIISKGAIVTQEKFSMLQSYKTDFDKRIAGQKKSITVHFGNFLIVLLIMIVFTLFLKYFSPKIYESNRNITFIFFIIAIVIIIEAVIVKSGLSVMYAIPFCIVPITTRTFFGAQTALHTYISLLLLSTFIIPYGTDFIVLQMLAGMVALFSMIRANYWSKFFISNGLILLTYFIGYFAISATQEGNLSNINIENLGWLVLNVLLVLLSYPFIPLFEKIFGFVSEITLLELTDINRPLLKELSLKAPGTFQHSLQVANLAEAAAYEIGTNTLLVKAGALYHDIGKTYNPTYFIENQSSNVNPHDELTFQESADIIISHVSNGIAMAKEHKLPDIIIDFIRTHHGDSRVEYFYQSYLKNFPEGEANASLFTYPGPLPYSKETAIVMMADTVEAAARSLKAPTTILIDEMVEKLIAHKIAQQQFINSNITFKEINTIKKVLKKMLHSIYHARVEYPK